MPFNPHDKLTKRMVLFPVDIGRSDWFTLEAGYNEVTMITQTILCGPRDSHTQGSPTQSGSVGSYKSQETLRQFVVSIIYC